MLTSLNLCLAESNFVAVHIKRGAHMLYKIVNRFPEDMIFKEVGPLISLYQPTHRYFPDNKKDPIVFKNLIREIEESLKEKFDSKIISTIMKPLYQLKDDVNFWNNTLDGIAVLASQKKCIVYNLHNPVKEVAVVSDSFHIKPLLQSFQSLENYQILGLSRENFSFYEGNKNTFQEIQIDKDVPRTMKDVLGGQLSEAYFSYGSHAGTGNPAIHYGHGGAKDETDKDTEKYFRYVDSFIHKNYSKDDKIPLILFALKEHHAQFKAVSNNPYLLEQSVQKSIETSSLSEIEKSARVIIDAINLKKIQKLSDSYTKAKADSLGSSDLVLIAKAAYEGRVKTLIIEEGKIIAGKIDYHTGDITPCELKNPDCDDVFDDLAELVLLNGGSVLVLTKDNMPSKSGVAAIFRYA